MNGWVYILRSDSMPELIKIGKTQRDPKDRANELSAATGVALPFRVIDAIGTDYISELESEVHEFFNPTRLNESREFFVSMNEETDDLYSEIIRALNVSLVAKIASEKAKNAYEIAEQELHFRFRKKEHMHNQIEQRAFELKSPIKEIEISDDFLCK